MSYLIKGKEYTDEEAYAKFINNFIGLIFEYKKYKVSGDYEISGFYAHNLAQSDRDPMQDADTVESDLYDEGWDDNNLKKLFTQYQSQLIEQLSDESRGGFDVFLYNWTNGNFQLGGGGIDISDFDEILVKYSYGWNRTKYGKLFLKQNNLIDNFTHFVANAYLNVTFKYIIRTLMCPGNSMNDYSSKEVMDKTFIKVIKFTKLEGNIITIHYKKITDIINLVMFINDKSESEELYSYSIFMKVVKDETSSELGVHDNKLNIDYNNDEDILTLTFN